MAFNFQARIFRHDPCGQYFRKLTKKYTCNTKLVTSDTPCIKRKDYASNCIKLTIFAAGKCWSSAAAALDCRN